MAGVAARLGRVSDGEKIERDDLASPLKARNSAWDGRTVRLFGARNEIVAFQVIVEADDEGIAALDASLPELRARRRGAIVYAPPAADPSQSVGPADPALLGALHERDAGDATPTGPGSPAARPRRATRTGWKPVVSSCPRTRARAAAASRSRVGRRPEPGALDRDLHGPRPAGRASTAARVTVTADGASLAHSRRARVLDFTLPDENSLRAMVYYEPDQPELYQGRNLDPAYHRFAHRQRVELVHAYDEAHGAARTAAASTARDFTRAPGYEGPGEGVGNSHRARARFYGPGRGYEERASAWKRVGRLDDLPGAALSRAPPRSSTCPTSPIPPSIPHVRALAENVRSNPGPAGSCPLFVTKQHQSRSSRGHRHLVRRRRRPSTSPARRGARGRAAGCWFYNGGRPQGPTLVDRRARHRRARRGLGGVQARRRRSTSTGTACTGSTTARSRASASRTCGPNPITFDNRGQPSKPVDDQGYLERRRRAPLPGRGEAPPRRGPRPRRARSHGPAREPAPRPPGPPVPDAGAPSSGSKPRWTRRSPRSCRGCSRTRARPWASPRPARRSRPRA